jgi:hypothetical protein
VSGWIVFVSFLFVMQLLLLGIMEVFGEDEGWR